MIKSTVETKFGLHRVGFSLVLQRLPSSIDAYHVISSNVIIIIKGLVDLIRICGSAKDYNSFLFMVLNEYLHSYGILDELQVRNMTYDLCQSIFGEDHLASQISKFEP